MQVTIEASQRVKYGRTIEMTPAEFAEINLKIRSLKGRQLDEYEKELAEKYLSHFDWVIDWDGFEDIEVYKEEEEKQ